ncbi:TPA: retention module-containing protein, partial [Kluyvera ascorbata]|nr:retention module-containing protein [Kluyvera ascorbata]
MNGIAGTIKAIIGQVFAISPDGTRRLLVEGDKLLAGEQIETGANGAVTLALPDGKTLDLGRDSHWDGGHGIATTPDATDTTDIAAIQQAIADGQDPTQILEATAAGPQTTTGSGEPGAGGAHTHVILDLTGERVDPTAGYPTEGLDFPNTPIEEELTVLDRSDTEDEGDSDADSDSDSDADADSD